MHYVLIVGMNVSRREQALGLEARAYHFRRRQLFHSWWGAGRTSREPDEPLPMVLAAVAAAADFSGNDQFAGTSQAPL